jgi:hypothetical protein
MSRGEAGLFRAVQQTEFAVGRLTGGVSQAGSHKIIASPVNEPAIFVEACRRLRNITKQELETRMRRDIYAALW